MYLWFFTQVHVVSSMKKSKSERKLNVESLAPIPLSSMEEFTSGESGIGTDMENVASTYEEFEVGQRNI